MACLRSSSSSSSNLHDLKQTATANSTNSRISISMCKPYCVPISNSWQQWLLLVLRLEQLLWSRHLTVLLAHQQAVQKMPLLLQLLTAAIYLQTLQSCKQAQQQLQALMKPPQTGLCLQE
jgi:hypothetical protein